MLVDIRSHLVSDYIRRSGYGLKAARKWKSRHKSPDEVYGHTASCETNARPGIKPMLRPYGVELKDLDRTLFYLRKYL